MKQKIFVGIGILGTLACLGVFIAQPSFPTPDKLLVFGICVAMIFSQALELAKRFVPFVGLLLVYESFRGVADKLNEHVNYLFMPKADKFLFFGHLPTKTLQNWWWHGVVRWYDFAFYLAYMMHFVMPLALAVIIWRVKDRLYWRFISTYVVVSFMGFLTYLIFPAAPPWMASDMGLIEPIVRISSQVWAALGVHDFPSVYNNISPNPVAAMPSLHAAYAMLFVLFATRWFKSKWRYLTWIYPFLIWVGTVYQGEHYAIDAIFGIIYALLAYWVTPHLLRLAKTVFADIMKKVKPLGAIKVQ